MRSKRPVSALPPETLRRLDPKLAALYTQLPSPLASRISFLLRAARFSQIHPNRILKFAYLYARAEQLTQERAISKEHTRRANLELAGYIHGLSTGYHGDAEAKLRYRRGRQARQQVKASLEAVIGKWRVFKQVIEKHRSELPEHVQSPYADEILSDISKKLQVMGIATVLDEEDLGIERSDERVRSEIAQTYIWWCLSMPAYRGKWKDMHELACTWRMSPAALVKRFRYVVQRILREAVLANGFGTAWDSVLSQK
jgi:hypothetical protein